MKIVTLPVGLLEANCYLVYADGAQACAVIDPGGEVEVISDACQTHGLTPELVLLTHGHADHMAAAAAVRQTWGARVMVHQADREFVESPHPYWAQMVGGAPAVTVDGLLGDGQELALDGLTLKVLHTPGHSPGSLCFLALDAVFTGDTLFAGSVGRTDLPGGSMATLEQSLRRLVDETGPETTVYPGHGPATTMGEEVRSNPWLR